MDRTGRGARIALLAVVGLAIAFFIWASNRADWRPTFITGISAQSDDAEISVTVAHSQCGRGPRVRVIRQTDDVVRLRAEQDEAGGGCDDVGLTSEIIVRLDRELGARSIEVEEPRASDGSPSVACVVDGEPDGRCVAIVLP